jgi:hypothetical protein
MQSPAPGRQSPTGRSDTIEPKGRLTKLEQSFLGQPWAKVRDGVQVRRLATDEDVPVSQTLDRGGCACVPAA